VGLGSFFFLSLPWILGTWKGEGNEERNEKEKRERTPPVLDGSCLGLLKERMGVSRDLIIISFFFFSA
jgi:hypothetical protein